MSESNLSEILTSIFSHLLFRKELQHMLHTRRKAEIEIISTVQYSRTQNQEYGMQIIGDENIEHNTTEHLKTRIKESPPLLDYLLGKINRSIAEKTRT